MNAGKGHSKNVDVVVMSVLTEGEHPALLATFGLEPFGTPDERGNDIKIWHTKLERSDGERLNVALTCLGDKGNIDSAVRTGKILDLMNPQSMYLVGTAAGRKSWTSICDVVVSSEGVIFYESGRSLDSGVGSKPKYVSPRPSVKNEVKYFHSSRMKILRWADEYKFILQKYGEDIAPLPMPEQQPRVHLEMVASGEKLLDETILESICEHNESVHAGEMEGYGFAKRCNELEIDWLVIRGISDFGSRQDREKWKTTATVMACSFLKIFLKHAFQPPRQPKHIERLPADSLYVREKVPDIVRRVLKAKSIDITPVKFSLDLTISELERICHILYPSIPFEELRRVVREARAAAFEQKYADRTEEDDERFMDIEQWKAEFRSLLFSLDILDLNAQRVINVGAGNGLEAKGLFDGIERFIGVDISQRALTRAKQRCPKMRCVVNDAEDLRDVENSSQDLYISLRTYQSTLFDINNALLEAYRALRPGGIILISIPNVFITENKRMVKGLLLPESDEVDPDLPYTLADKIRRMLNLLNFDRIGIHTGMVEVYIYGQRGR